MDRFWDDWIEEAFLLRRRKVEKAKAQQMANKRSSKEEWRAAMSQRCSKQTRQVLDYLEQGDPFSKYDLQEKVE